MYNNKQFFYGFFDSTNLAEYSSIGWIAEIRLCKDATLEYWMAETNVPGSSVPDWHQYTITKQSNKIKYYIDGQLSRPFSAPDVIRYIPEPNSFRPIQYIKSCILRIVQFR